MSSYWCCATYPDDGGLLGVGVLLVDVDALLQVEQQGHAGHEAQHDVQAETERVHLCWDTQNETQRLKLCPGGRKNQRSRRAAA